MKIEEGSRVRIIRGKHHIGRVLAEDTGTVQYRSPSGSCYIRGDRYDDRKHDNMGRCEKGHGWMLYDADLELLQPEDLGDLSTSACLDMKFLFGM